MRPNDDLCDVCGYHLILKKVIDISDMKRPNRSAGFERVLQDQLHGDESSHDVLLWMKVAAGVFVLVCLILCLRAWWWVGVLALGGCAALYWWRYGHRSPGKTGDSALNQDPFARMLWTSLLTIQRMIGWRKFEWPPDRTKALRLCDPTFNDEELGGLTGLDNVETLDLEGTGVSNEGLQFLRGRKNLRFLVVRNTHVTPAGAARLQQDLPQTLIWY